MKNKIENLHASKSSLSKELFSLLRATKAGFLFLPLLMFFGSCGENLHWTAADISVGVSMPPVVDPSQSYNLSGSCAPDGGTVTLSSADMSPSPITCPCVGSSYTCSTPVQFDGTGPNGPNPEVEACLSDTIGNSQCAEDTASIPPPSATDDSGTGPSFGAPVVVNVDANDIPGGAPLDPSSIALIGTQPNPSTEGSCSIGPAPNYDMTFTPVANFVDSVQCPYEICDTLGQCVQAVATFDPHNGAPPVAANDTAQTPLNTPVTVDVVANDSDPDSNLDPNSLSLTGPQPNSATEGSCSVTGAPPQLQFTPVTGYTGTASCTYQICDLNSSTPQCTTAVLEVEVVPGPIANDDSGSGGSFGAPVVVDVDANDTPQGAPLDPSSISLLTTGQPNPTTEGSCAVSATAPYDVTFTPVANYVGPATCDYEICDTSGLCDTATITFDPHDGAPPVAVDDSTTTPIDTPVTYDVVANDTDPDANLDPNSLSVTGTNQPNPTTEGVCTVTGTPPQLTFTPVTGFLGTASCEYQVCDLNSPTPQCVTADLEVEVINEPIANITGDTPDELGRINSFTDAGIYNDSTCPGVNDRETEWYVDVNGTNVSTYTFATLPTTIVTTPGLNASSNHAGLVIDDWTTYLTTGLAQPAPTLSDEICVYNKIKNCAGTISASDSNKVCFLSPEKEVFGFTGADLSTAPPPGASEMLVKVWGAAGGSAYFRNGLGGPGGYASAKFDVTSALYTIVVGEGGKTSSLTSTYGGGGAGGKGGWVSAYHHASSGGGLSGVFDGSILSAGSALIIAGGGGGAGTGSNNAQTGGGAGAGGGLLGTDAPNRSTSNGGKGGSQVAGGISSSDLYPGFPGVSLMGGAGVGFQIDTPTDQNDNASGGGGGGYFGGSGGGYNTSNFNDVGGGGGSGFVDSSASVLFDLLSGTQEPTLKAGTAFPPMILDEDYLPSVGVADKNGIRVSNGGDGLVVVWWIP